jgi:hypothetical protein
MVLAPSITLHINQKSALLQPDVMYRSACRAKALDMTFRVGMPVGWALASSAYRWRAWQGRPGGYALRRWMCSFRRL